MFTTAIDAVESCPTSDEGIAPFSPLRLTRQSFLEPVLPNEPWIGSCGCIPNLLVLYLLNHPVSLIAALRMYADQRGR